MEKLQVALEVERLLQFALKHKMIEAEDMILSRNLLLDLFKLEEPYKGQVPWKEMKSPVEILEGLLDYSYEAGILEDNTTTYRDLLDAKIMGILMPRQSEVTRNFYKTYYEEGRQQAADSFYALSQASNYIRMDRIEKNLYWLSPTEYGNLEITVNLSKPEKDPKEIAASKQRPQSNYPKCLLCIENVGFGGHVNHPARQNHRVIPMELNKEQFYFQYSPYVYYNEHCIVFHEQHVPMKISEKTFKRLFDFVEILPHYFIGSNADLPIVGGSILSHEHFQGGSHDFPMAIAEVETYFQNDKYSNVRTGIVKWPMSVIRMASKNKEELITASIEALKQWREYSDIEAGIHAYSEIKGEKVPHNTITPIVRINKECMYEIDLVLRNNRTSEEHPDGIFHPHKELHHIKKENIGLIEVMGLAVLPGRLDTELKEVGMILQGDMIRLNEAEENTADNLHKHIQWVKELAVKYGTACTKEKAEEILKLEVGDKFLKVLLDSGVYKRDAAGRNHFVKFMNKLGFKMV